MSSPQTVTFQIDGMTCASCVGRVEHALSRVAGVSSATVNLAAETAQVTFDAPAGSGDLLAAVSDTGYNVVTDEFILGIQGMHCASCVGRVEKALANAPGVVDAHVNLATETAHVHVLHGAQSGAELARIITAAGYIATPRPAHDQSEIDRKAEQSQRLGQMTLLAAILALPVFVIEMGSHVIPGMHGWIAGTIGMQTSRVVQFLLTTAVLFGPGRQFYTLGLPALLRRAPDMNSLVALGTLAAYGYSVVATFLPGILPAGTANVYFEAAAVIVVLILLGRWLESRAKGRTGAAIRKLVGLRPKTARVTRDGEIRELPIDSVVVGDILHLRPGERIAVDGTVETGESWVDESMITGEPVPVAKTKGAPVVAGTVNGTGALTFRATGVGADTMLAQIIAMVEQAQGAKLPIQGLVDRITAWFVPAVLASAALTVLVWLIFGPSPALGLALVAGVAVLIIACPCAMGLATPTSIMVGTGRAAELGVLFRKGDALQMLQEVRIVALDKTGTLTAGQPELTDLTLTEGFSRNAVLAQVAAVEALSEHPIANAILRAAQKAGLSLPDVTDFTSITGYGVQAMIEGKTVLIGADRLMRKMRIDPEPLTVAAGDLASKGRTPLFAAIDGRLAALIGVADPIKPSTPAAIAALQKMGLRVAMITGDDQTTADAIAADLGIDRVVAQVLPADKVAALDALKQGGRIAFVGDGINDAPALAHSDVGIAIGTGTDIAIEAADVVLISGDLRGVVNAFAISRHTMRNIRQNLFWAFGYNILLIPVAAGVLYPFSGLMLSPVLAAGAMALSSVFVLSNALRLRWVAPADREVTP